jgi:hypothetical protein
MPSKRVVIRSDPSPPSPETPVPFGSWDVLGNQHLYDSHNGFWGQDEPQPAEWSKRVTHMGVIKLFLSLLPYDWALRWLHLHRMLVARCSILHVSCLRTLRFETVS